MKILICFIAILILAMQGFTQQEVREVGVATSSTTTAITSSTTVTLNLNTSQVRLVAAPAGTTYYMMGAGTASASNAIPLSSGQIVFDDTFRAGARISVTGSGALLIQLIR